MTTIPTNQSQSSETILSKTVLMVAIVIGVLHTVAWSGDLDKPLLLAWRFASVGTLALYAFLNARSLDGWLLVGVMLLSACSDVMLVAIGQEVGAVSFIIADFIAITLYCRNLRPNLGFTWFAAVALFVGAIAAISYVLPSSKDDGVAVAAFVIPLATMAGIACLTRFNPMLVGLGAMLVLSSDVLIFARMGPLKDLAGLTEVVWLMYFIGEVLVVIGVTRYLRQKGVPARD